MPHDAARRAGDPVAQWTERLLTDGYAVIPGAMPPEEVAAIDAELGDAFDQTPFCQGGFYGTRTKRFGRLLARTIRAAAFVQHPLVLGVAERVLAPWCDTIQLNLTQAIALHPGALPQFPHRDQDMWQGETGRIEYLVNVMWPFTGYTTENGATLIWPHSHGPRCHDPEPVGEPIVAEMAPGAALMFLGSTLHGAGGNRSATVRRGMIVSYCLGWLKPYENPWLAYPPEVARHFPRELAALAGYRQHRPNLGNYEGQCPSILLDGSPAEPLGAVDALRPDQAEGVAAFVASQRA
ncbi:phytanoyl-CoA dioxygenase family protein [Sphingomonas cannabina]|uniref:phytanoyl-CoA dioxygenase family protein n=1 Tax=Sphingomonas cannabina TaxID=2899123 RepID=UPI001F385E03|nr:phytanoyl-CoA dioxygenase family protein [Sphingomonas cannabina]UIJ44791.1 phytanoyl-CoA dioxygenase family protein [Sphingomonas cannabina]